MVFRKLSLRLLDLTLVSRASAFVIVQTNRCANELRFGDRCRRFIDSISAVRENAKEWGFRSWIKFLPEKNPSSYPQSSRFSAVPRESKPRF